MRVGSCWARLSIWGNCKYRSMNGSNENNVLTRPQFDGVWFNSNHYLLSMVWMNFMRWKCRRASLFYPSPRCRTVSIFQITIYKWKLIFFECRGYFLTITGDKRKVMNEISEGDKLGYQYGFTPGKRMAIEIIRWERLIMESDIPQYRYPNQYRLFNGKLSLI